MRITWDDNEKRFEAQFSTGDLWQSDKDLAQGVGFRTDGPPAWIWFTTKASSLTELKVSASALSVPILINITRPALDVYNRLRKSEERNEEIKKLVKEQKKFQKKKQERAKIDAQKEDGEEVEPEYEPRHYNPVPEYWKGKHEITRDDLPADILARSVRRESAPRWLTEPIGLCIICAEATYFPEDSDNCFWCQGHGEEKFFENLLDS